MRFNTFRDWPFNFMVFVSFRIFFWTTQELEYLFFLSRKAQIFIPEFNIRLYYKNSNNQINFFFLHQKQNIFFSNIGNQNIFLEKNPIQVKWSFPYYSVSEWLLFNANSTIFQLYHGKNKLIFEDMKKRSAL